MRNRSYPGDEFLNAFATFLHVEIRNLLPYHHAPPEMNNFVTSISLCRSSTSANDEQHPNYRYCMIELNFYDCFLTETCFRYLSSSLPYFRTLNMIQLAGRQLVSTKCYKKYFLPRHETNVGIGINVDCRTRCTIVAAIAILLRRELWR